MKPWLLLAFLAGTSLGHASQLCGTLRASAGFSDSDGNPASLQLDLEVNCSATSTEDTSDSIVSPPSVDTNGVTQTPTSSIRAKATESSPTNLPDLGPLRETVPRIASNTQATASLPITTHTVEVGMQSQLLFNPEQVQAGTGDVVLFNFHSLNHTLTESSLQTPCEAVQGGFDSGFTNLNPTGNEKRQVSFTIAESTPRWFFCKQAIPYQHCSSGMVFAINPGSDMNMFLDNARARTRPLTPGSSRVEYFNQTNISPTLRADSSTLWLVTMSPTLGLITADVTQSTSPTITTDVTQSTSPTITTDVTQSTSPTITTDVTQSTSPTITTTVDPPSSTWIIEPVVTLNPVIIASSESDPALDSIPTTSPTPSGPITGAVSLRLEENGSHISAESGEISEGATVAVGIFGIVSALVCWITVVLF